MLSGGDGGQQKRIVSIAGFGGLGKTTLAKAVYDEIKAQFDCTAFVSVSRNPDTQKLLKDMLYELDKEKFADIHSKMLDERFLIDKLMECLTTRRYVHASAISLHICVVQVFFYFWYMYAHIYFFNTRRLLLVPPSIYPKLIF
jgi:disease resistance protein RPM1